MLCLCDEREEVDNGQAREDDDGRGHESVPHVVEEAEPESGYASRLLGHDEVGDAPQECDVAREGGEPGEEETDDRNRAGFLALPRGADEVGNLLDDQDRHGYVAQYLAPDDDEDGEEDDSAHRLEVHGLSDGEEDDSRDAGVLEPLEPVEQTHEHEEDSPVHLGNGVEGVLLVQASVDNHENDSRSERDDAQVEVGGDGGRGWDGQEDDDEDGDGDEDAQEDLLAPRALHDATHFHHVHDDLLDGGFGLFRFSVRVSVALHVDHGENDLRVLHALAARYAGSGGDAEVGGASLHLVHHVLLVGHLAGDVGVGAPVVAASHVLS